MDIKFRFFDTIDKKMFQWEDIIKSVITFKRCFTENSIIKLQYTGLKDDQENEIYVGDICKFHNDDTFIVKTERWLEWYGEWIGEPECEDQLRDLYRAERATIIGNIYTNALQTNQ